MTSCLRLRVLRTAFAAIVVVGAASAQAPVYLNLPAPANANSFTYGVNQSGQVLGAYVVGLGEQLFVWQGGNTTTIGDSNHIILFAAINNLGQVAYTQNHPIASYLWSNGTITQIGNIVVAAINDQGVVTGCQENLIGQFGNRQSVIWNGGDPAQIKPTGGNSPFSCAFGINNSSQVAGAFYDFNGTPVSGGYIWYQGNTSLLGSLGGSYTVAADINDAGQVVGAALNSSNAVEAFLWQNNVIQPLGFPQGETNSAAVRIDSTGRIAGNSSKPWVWENGAFTELGGGACNARACALPVATGVANTGTGGIVSGNCINQAANARLSACLWNVP
jgi:probable HAF family extracellular repeat protein